MKQLLCAIVALLLPLSVSARDYRLQSPTGRLTVTVQDAAGQLLWSVNSHDIAVLQPSAIAVSSPDAQLGATKTALRGAGEKAGKTYQSLLLSCAGGYIVEFRAFDDAAAYRITFPKKGIRVNSETAEFNFPSDLSAYIPYVNDNRGGERWCYSFESYYDRQPLSAMFADSLAISPLGVRLDNGGMAVVMEAGVENYPGMYLLRQGTHGLRAAFPPYPQETEVGGFNRLNLVPVKRANYIAEKATQTPWRIVVCVDKDAELLGNRIAEALSAECRIADTSWIKPGKVAWDWWNNTNLTGVDFRAGINTDTYKYFVDFAQKNRLEYIIIDEGWSDPEDLLTFSDKMDMDGIIRYAREHGVGVILWSSWRNLTQRGAAKMEEIMAHYQQLGVSGFKVDFFDRDDQPAIRSAYEVAACAARHHLLLDLHGLKPFGIEWAYPNIVNFEGVKGLENSKWEPRTADGPLHDQPAYDVTIPYLRMLAGPMDYTPGAMVNATKDMFFGNNDHPMSQGTRVHQMAMYTTFYAPLQMLADSPSKYIKEQECLDFISKIPTTWDETIGLDGRAGEYCVIARRKGATWYIAAMTNWQPRDLTIRLDGLRGLEKKANIFADGVNADREATDYRHTTIELTENTLAIHLAPGGGWTAIIE